MKVHRASKVAEQCIHHHAHARTEKLAVRVVQHGPARAGRQAAGVKARKNAGPVLHQARRTAAMRYSVVALRTSVDDLAATLVAGFMLARSGAAGLAFTTAATGLLVLDADASLAASGQAIALAPTKASAIRKVFMGDFFHEFWACKA